MGLMEKVADKIIMRKARAEFEKRGDHCEHQEKGVCDDCLKAAIKLAKEQAAGLTFTEKIRLLKAAKAKK